MAARLLKMKEQVVHNEDGTTIFPTSQGKSTATDTVDFPMYYEFNWYHHVDNKTGRVSVRANARTEDNKRVKITLHDLLFGFPEKSPKHLDGDPTNNRRSNFSEVYDGVPRKVFYSKPTKEREFLKDTRTIDESIFEGDFVKIPLSRGMFAEIWVSDFELVKNFTWAVYRGANTWYASTNITKEDGTKTQNSMHRLIMGNPENSIVDHEDRNGLNNRRDNLRICTKQENARNANLAKNSSSGVKGVSWNKNRNYWEAHISVNQKKIHLGCFHDLKEATAARLKAEQEIDPEFFHNDEQETDD